MDTGRRSSAIQTAVAGHSHRLGNAALLLAAGMPRSASTWLYNAVRYALASHPHIAPLFVGGWIDDRNSLPAKPYTLLKLHDFVPELAGQAKLVFYSYRDIRDVVASLQRKFSYTPSLDFVGCLTALHERWLEVADEVIRYEDLLRDERPVILRIARRIGVTIDARAVADHLAGLSYLSPGPKNSQYHQTNLYHAQHVTDGRHGSWRETLDDEFLAEVENRYGGWLRQHGYSLSAPTPDRKAKPTASELLPGHADQTSSSR
jgi:hypothetical protein